MSETSIAPDLASSTDGEITAMPATTSTSAAPSASHSALIPMPTSSPTALALASHAGLPDPQVIRATIDRGLAADADDAARVAARELWLRLSVVMSSAMPATIPAAGGMAGASGPAGEVSAYPAMPMAPGPTSPVVAIVQTLRQLPPDQLLDLVIGRLRAALPAGVTVANPRGISFPLVPMPGSSDPSGPR